MLFYALANTRGQFKGFFEANLGKPVICYKSRKLPTILWVADYPVGKDTPSQASRSGLNCRRQFASLFNGGFGVQFGRLIGPAD